MATVTKTGPRRTTGAEPLCRIVPGDVATFGTGGVGLPVNLDQNETVGGIAFANASSYTITGANTLTLDGSGHGAAIGVTAGTANAINTPVALNDNVTATVNCRRLHVTLGGAIANLPPRRR